MDELLPYYERELGFLRRYSSEFAEKYPKIAGRLLMVGEVCEDPHIERLIQSFALLNSRISKRLDDDYPEFTEALFEVLYPHYLRAFPSCSIAKFDFSSAQAQMTNIAMIPRGTEFTTRPVKGAACRFRSAYDVPIAPIRLTHAKFDAIGRAPEAVVLPPTTSSILSVTFELSSEQVEFSKLSLNDLRVFIDGEMSFCAGLRDSLFINGISAFVEIGQSGKWHALGKTPIKSVGFDEEDSLISFPARSHPAYRLLTEYFSFPEKFNFFDIELASIKPILLGKIKSFTLHLALSGIRADSNMARMLSNLSAKNLLLGCTPVINLFKQRGDPIRLSHTAASYPVIADSRRAFAYDVYSIDNVKMVRQSPQGEMVTEFRPFYSLQHGHTEAKSGHYWVAHRDDMMALKSPGYETEISIVDIDFDPAKVETQTLSLSLTCTNRDLPASLAYGLPGGDLFLEGGSLVSAIHFLRKPTNTHRFERGRGAHWRLISHLSLNHLSLTRGGLDAFKEMLSLYDLPRSAISRRQIDGVVAINHKAAKAWLPGNPFACLLRGIEIQLTVNEENFVGSGLHVFVELIDRFFGLYVTANSFTQLVVMSHKTGEELLRCKARSGDLNLV